MKIGHTYAYYYRILDAYVSSYFVGSGTSGNS